MQHGFPTAAKEFGLKRDENFVFALELLSARKELPADHPEGKLRLGNILIAGLAMCFGESQFAIRRAAEEADGYGYVPDQLIEDAVRILRYNKVRFPDCFNDELQASIDFGYATGLIPEVQWMTEKWGVEPSPSVTAPLATR